MQQKAFLFWMAKHQESIELTRGLRELQTKQKVWYQLDIHCKQSKLKKARVDTYYRQKLLLKSFFGFLKILEERRDVKRQATTVTVKESQKRSFSGSTGRNSTVNRSPSKENRFKRRSSSKTKRGEASQGIVNVVPVIDKKIDGVYDLDVVNIRRKSAGFDDNGQHKPLLNAI